MQHTTPKGYPFMSLPKRTSRRNLIAVPDVDEAQLTIDDAAEPEAPAFTSMTARFIAFHSENKHVYGVLLRLAREWKARGKGQCSITLLYNKARWELSIRTEGDGIYELNDHFQAYYARALMWFNEDLDGMFHVRRAPEADAWIASQPAQPWHAARAAAQRAA